MRADLRYALRTLAHSPALAAVAILSLALGIGANTAIFSLLDQVLLRLLPVREPEQLVVLHTPSRNWPGMSMSDNSLGVFSYPMYKDLRDRNQVFSGMIARAAAPVSLGWNGQTERASAEIVSGNFFDVLGVTPLLGRTLTQRDDLKPDANPVVVLTRGYWARRFGSNPAILNQKIIVNGHPMLVVGVTPPGFYGVLTGRMPDMFVPINMKREITPTWYGLDDRRAMWLNLFARLRPGVSIQQAEAAIETALRPILEEEAAQMTMRSQRARDRFLNNKLQVLPAAQGINVLSRRWRTPLIALMAMVGLVLLIACANVANLLIARAAGRQREIAIRLALGAAPSRLVRQLLVEGLLLAVTGGLLGLAVARGTTAGLLRLLPSGLTGNVISAGIDARMLAFNLALSVVTGVLFGLLPAWQSTRPDLTSALRDQSAGSGTSGSQARFRRAVVAGQVALSLLLLVGAGLFSRSLVNLMTLDPGFRADNLLTFAVDPRLNGYGQAQSIAMFQEIERRLASLGGVMSVSASEVPPLAGMRESANVTVEGYQAREDENTDCDQDPVGPNYFRTLGIPLVAGGEFTEADGADAPKVVIVNEEFARHFFGDRNAIGQHMAFGAGTNLKFREIVGVVKNSKGDDLRGSINRFVYFPYAQDDRIGRLTFYVRTTRPEESLGPEVRRLVSSLDANLPVFAMRSMKAQLEDSIYADRLIAVLAGAFGLLATLLASIGLYGVLAYTVARRTAEIGIRMALGALTGDVLWLVMKEVLRLAGIGIVLGLGLAWALGRYVQSQLFGLTAGDPIVFGGAALALGAIALAAGFLPARRATRIDPIRALRYE